MGDNFHPQDNQMPMASSTTGGEVMNISINNDNADSGIQQVCRRETILSLYSYIHIDIHDTPIDTHFHYPLSSMNKTASQCACSQSA